VIRCPYHAWVYELDGSLRGAPSFAAVEGFDRAEFPLIPAGVAEWRGWIFVDAGAEAGPFGERVGNLDQVMGPYEPERLRVAARHDYEVEANWKLLSENYHECYHCSSIHPELCRVTPIDSGVDLRPEGAWAGGTMELMDHAATMSLSGESRGVPLRGLDERQRREVIYAQLFPNLLISAHPDYVLTHRLEPLSPRRTRVTCQWLFPPEAFDLEGFDPSYAVEFWDLTNRQDWAACESVQRGLASPHFRPGPLAPNEDAVHQWVRLVASCYLDPAGALSCACHDSGAAPVDAAAACVDGMTVDREEWSG
jgi:glycine betaine catabolism A